jgi:phospholipase/lecithinase/hemolysin
MRMKISAAAFIVCLGASPASASAYPALYDFGDSLSDVGNVYTATRGVYPVAPYDDGRFSNGLNWVDDLSARLGLGAVTPSARGGHNFAVGGAQTGPTLVNTGVAGFAGVPLVDLDRQVRTFKLLVPSPKAGELYTLDIGANDIGNALSAYASNSAALTTFLGQAVGNAVRAVDELFADGARSLLYFEVPDLSVVPAFEKYGALAGSLAKEFNRDVIAGVAPLEAEGLKVFDAPIFADLDAIVANPGRYGFANVTGPCFSGGPTKPGVACADPAQYLFWDSEHPTAAAHAIVADVAYATLQGPGAAVSSGAVAAAAPEPGTWALVLAGLAGLGLVRASRKKAAAG